MAEYSINRKLKFMNPYNFVSMEKKTSERKSADDNQGELLSGVLKCRMITRTPLAILETESVKTKENGHPIYDFYKIEGIPAIPGSSIRGVLRSCYETLTDSCFVTMSSSEKELITERVPATSPFKPGVLILEDGEWHLYNATRGKLEIGDEYKVEKDPEKGRYIKAGNQIFENGEYVEAEFVTYESTNRFNKKVNVTKAEYIKKCASNKSKFVLFIGETINKKSSESVFRIDKKIEKTDTVIKNALAGLENSLLIYRDAKINKKYGKEHTGYRNYDYAKKNGVIPLWYKEENNILYFSIAAIGRKSFSTSINDLIGEMRTPCTCRDNMCQACKMFGMSKKEAYGSHIRISDAIGTKVSLTESTALKELGTPRPGYYLFYGKDGKAYDEIQAGIAGRKYYWHNPKASTDPSVYEESDSKKITERNASCVLAESGSEFEFQVYYDKISSAQLKQLMWIIALGDNSKESNYCHKIGHGKPIGLGSVKLLIEENLVRNVGDDLEYSFDDMPINIESEPAEGLIKSVWDKQMKYMLDFNFVQDYIISYPFVAADMQGYEGRVVKDNVLASHQWFSRNKDKIKKNEAQILQPLNGNIADESMLLYAYSAVLDDKDFERNSNTVSFTAEKEYKAEVIALEDKYIVARVQEKKIKIYFKESDIKLQYGQIDKVLAVNDKIQVRYLGKKPSKDGKKYDTWHLIGKA